jgi:hypothetical protein
MPRDKSEAVNRRRTDNTIKKDQRTNHDPQNTTKKTKDLETRTPIRTAVKLVVDEG